MEKSLFRGFILYGMLLFFVAGCSKENDLAPSNATNGSFTNAPITRNVTVIDGVLSFESEGQLFATMNDLSMMEIQDRIVWEDQHGFRSIGTIRHLVNEAEVQNQEQFFAGVDPDLEVADYERMGLFYEPSSLYSEYLDKRVITETIDEKGARSFAPTIDEPGYENVLDEQGRVIVDGNILIFDGTTRRVMKLAGKGLEVVPGTEKITSNGQYNFKRNARLGGFETLSGDKYWITDLAKGNKYRYYAQASFSSGYTVSLLSQTFFWTARAEHKKWGNWATRNNYLPIWGISAHWSYDYWIIYNGAGYGVVRDGSMYPLPNSTPWPTSPYSLSNLNTNYTVRYLHPHGMFTYSYGAGFQFFENTRVYNHGWTFKFSGGPSGYSYVGQ